MGGGGGEVRQVVSPPFPFPPLPLSIPPKFSDKSVGGKVRSSEGEVPRLPPTNTTLLLSATLWYYDKRMNVGQIRVSWCSVRSGVSASSFRRQAAASNVAAAPTVRQRSHLSVAQTTSPTTTTV